MRVQRDNARKCEKIDFLEEHVQDLVNELKKKNRILQSYFLKEESGVLASEASDRNKVSSPVTHQCLVDVPIDFHAFVTFFVFYQLTLPRIKSSCSRYIDCL